eukprot:PhM_4_TR12802/c0_g1_i1/m.34106
MPEVETQTGYWIPPSDPHGPKVYFRCVVPDGRTLQLKLAEDACFGVLFSKLPSPGPYEWHGVCLDASLTPSHYNMNSGEENCVTLVHVASSAVPSARHDQDKVRALYFTIRQLEDELNHRTNAMHSLHLELETFEETKRQLGLREAEVKELRKERSELNRRLAEFSHIAEVHKKASFMQPAVDAEREDKIHQLSFEIQQWQRSIEEKLRTNNPPQDVIVSAKVISTDGERAQFYAENGGRRAVFASLNSNKVHEPKPSAPPKQEQQLNNSESLTAPPPQPQPIPKHVSHSTSHSSSNNRAPEEAKKPSPTTATTTTKNHSVTVTKQTPRKATTTPTSQHQSLSSSSSKTPVQVQPRAVRVIVINEATGSEERLKISVVPPVNLRRTMEAVKQEGMIKDEAIKKAVVCVQQSETGEPSVVDVVKEGKRVLGVSDVVYVAVLK